MDTVSETDVVDMEECPPEEASTIPSETEAANTGVFGCTERTPPIAQTNDQKLLMFFLASGF